MPVKRVVFKNFDEEHFIRFVKWGYDPTGSCIRDFKKYKSCMLIKGNENLASFKTHVELFFKSNKKSLTFLLSGGLDSSILFALFMRANKKTEFEILFNPDNDDPKYLNALLEMYDVPRYRVREIRWDKPNDGTLLRMMRAQSSPMDLGSMQANFELIRNSWNRVIVTGDGSDEVFGGYTRHKFYDTSLLDIQEELLCYHIPRVNNLCNTFGRLLFSPYLKLIDSPDRLFAPGKTKLKELAKGLIPDCIIEREKQPLKSEDAKIGLEYRARLVKIWKEADEDYERIRREIENR